MRPAFVAALLALSAGCLDASSPAAGSEAKHHLGGAFTAEATQADLDEASRLAAAEGADLHIMESFPLQFSARDMALEGCERLRAALAAKAYVASVRACEPAIIADEPDAGVSSS